MKISIPSKNLFIADSSNLADFFFQYDKYYDHCTFEVPKTVFNYLLEEYDYDSDKVDPHLINNGNLPTTVEFIKNNPTEIIEWHPSSYALFIPFNSDVLEVTSFENGLSIKPSNPSINNTFSYYKTLGLLSVDGAHLTLMDSQNVTKENIDSLRENLPFSWVHTIDEEGVEHKYRSYNGSFSLLDGKVIFDWKFDGLIKAYNLYNSDNELIECVLLYCCYNNGNYNIETNIELAEYLRSFNM